MAASGSLCLVPQIRVGYYGIISDKFNHTVDDRKKPYSNLLAKKTKTLETQFCVLMGSTFVLKATESTASISAMILLL